MLSLLALLGFVGFLLGVTPVVRRGGAFSRARVALVPFVLLCLMSLILASPRFGNRLAASEWYWPVAGRILLMLALTIGTPLALSAAAIRTTMRAGRNDGVHRACAGHDMVLPGAPADTRALARRGAVGAWRKHRHVIGSRE